MVCLFFFKQKTAYEMRISDWSSDVCSSDLRAGAFLLPALFDLGQRRLLWQQQYPAATGLCLPARHDRGLHGRQWHAKPEQPVRGIRAECGAHWPLDRKSVVTGKSVSVRVDRGGRRIIKKKNTGSK